MLPLVARMRRLSGQLSPDAQAVADATDALGVKPFELFAIAYRQWYGRAPREKELERLFMAHLYGQETPHWARHFARQVLALAARGQLDRTAYGLPPQPARQGMSLAELERWSLLIYACAIAVIFLLVPMLR